MLAKLKQRKEEGFTIIEVMIVLAIAGLIILVVLLAVPALQRNSRNTTIKNDASAIAATINEFTGSNNGRQPTTVTCADGVVTVGGTTGTQVTGKVQGGTNCGTGAMPTAPGQINVTFGNRCNADNNALGPVSRRAAAIMYVTETTGNPIPQCLDS